MELTRHNTPAVGEIVSYALSGTFTATSRLKFEIDAEELNVAPPEGKTWKVRLELHIDES